MPWCPNCKVEYLKGFNMCSDCQVELVDELEPETFIDLGPPAYLTRAANEIEASIIESLLTSNGIPTLLKHRSVGAYLSIYMGMSSYGVDICVPESLLEEAQALIDDRSETPDEIMEISPEADNSYDDSTRRQRAGLLLNLFWLAPFLLYLISKFFSG